MLALAQLIFQGLTVNTHFQKKALYLAAVSSLLLLCFPDFSWFSFETHEYHLLPVLSSTNNAGLAAVADLLSGRSILPHTHPSAACWPQPVLGCLRAVPSLCSSDCFLLQLFLCCFHGIHIPVLRQSPTITPAHPSVSLQTSSLLWLDLLLYSALQPPLVYAHSFNSPNFFSLTAISIFQIPGATSPFLCWIDLDESYVLNSYFLKETFWLLSNCCLLIKIWKLFRFSNLVGDHLWARQKKVFFLLLTNTNRVSSFSDVYFLTK